MAFVVELTEQQGRALVQVARAAIKTDPARPPGLEYGAIGDVGELFVAVDKIEKATAEAIRRSMRHNETAPGWDGAGASVEAQRG